MRELIRLIEDLNRPFAFEQEAAYPDVDIHENAEKVTILLDVPGLKRDDIEVTLDGRRLTIRGDRKSPFTRKEGERLTQGRAYGSFRRTFTLSPLVDESKLSADLADGVLTVTVQKVERAKPKRIAIGS